MHNVCRLDDTLMIMVISQHNKDVPVLKLFPTTNMTMLYRILDQAWKQIFKFVTLWLTQCKVTSCITVN